MGFMSEFEAKEIEVVGEKKDVERKQKKPKKPQGEHENSIRFWTRFTMICYRFALPGLFLGLAAGLCFWILYSQGTLAQTSFVAMWIGFAVAFVFAILMVFGLIGTAFLRRLRAEDPNYSGE